MKIAIKILENIIKEEIEKAGVNDPMRRNRTFAPPLRSEIEEEPVAGYILQTLNREWPTLASQRDLEQLQNRIADLETKMAPAMADTLKTPPSLKENKENPMKITRKILENIIKEELASILQEQDPIKAKEKILADLKAEIKAEKDPKKKKKLEKELEDKEVELAGPGESSDQSINEEQDLDLEGRRIAMEKLAALIKAEKDPKKRADLQFALLLLSSLPSFSMDPGAGNKVADPDPRSK